LSLISLQIGDNRISSTNRR